jgi:hypothetical protein
MNYPDIYFEPKWAELYSVKDNGEPVVFSYSTDDGIISYSFIKREINIELGNDKYYDIITPYGFSGPIIIEGNNSEKKRLLDGFKKDFDNYCHDNLIITDSCRFSPWIKNHLDFTHMYELIPNNSTVGIDLSVNDIFSREISSKKRNMIRKAKKIGVEIKYDFLGNKVSDFLRLYEQTIVKHQIVDYYKFDYEFLIKNFEKLKGNIFIAYAEYENKIISIAIFINSNDYLHYHLAANDSAFYGIPSNDLLIYEVAEYAKKSGYKFLMLGGAGGNKAIHRHKMGFTKNSEFPFFKGKRICNTILYNKILEKSEKIDLSFFPSYR